MVMEKGKEIGILRALGTDHRKLMSIFLAQGMFIGVVGVILGNVIAFVMCWLELKYRIISLPSGVYFMTHVPIDLNGLNFLVVSMLALLMCFLSSIIPSRIAAKRDPIQMIKFGS
jgi:lipoprotein-releasing system permease protein